MELRLKDVAKVLQVSEKTIYRWIKDNKIPYYRINHQYRFKADEINQWTIRNKYDVLINQPESTDIAPPSIEANLKNGGIYYNISGENVTEVIQNAIGAIRLPPGLDHKTILEFLLNREKMAPTAIGNGIAFPHPRNPTVSNVEDESLSICFLHREVDFNALDGIPVNTLFIILSANQTRHLQLLSKLSFLCRDKKFLKLIKTQPLREKLMEFIAKFHFHGTGY